jgi:hypothetical protein
MEIGGVSSVPCGVYKNINPSFKLLNWKTHIPAKANGLHNVHKKNLKEYLNMKVK